MKQSNINGLNNSSSYKKWQRRPVFRRSKLLIFEIDDDLITLWLSLSAKHKTFTEQGGRIEPQDGKGDSGVQSAVIREVKEELLNSLDISNLFGSDYIFHFDVPDGRYMMRVHCICVQKGVINEELFDLNRQLLKEKKLSYGWQEMSDLTRFRVYDILTNPIVRKDEYNTVIKFPDGEYTIYNPVIKYLIIIQKNRWISRIKRHIVTKYDTVHNETDSFLRDTRTTVLKS